MAIVFQGSWQKRFIDSTLQAMHQVQGGLFLDITVWQSGVFLQTCPQKQVLFAWKDALLVLNFSFDILKGVIGLKLESAGLALQGTQKDLPFCVCHFMKEERTAKLKTTDLLPDLLLKTAVLKSLSSRSFLRCVFFRNTFYWFTFSLNRPYSPVSLYVLWFFCCWTEHLNLIMGKLWESDGHPFIVFFIIVFGFL